MKRIIPIFLSLSMLLGLAACGNSPAASSAPSSAGSTASVSKPSSASEPIPTPESAPTPESTPASVPETAPEPASSRILVAYFSATGNTKAVAEAIAETTGADLYELVPQEPYTDADLNWNDPGSRVNAEHEDAGFRTAIAGEPKDLSGYDVIFLGYPLWWRQAPSIVQNFVESSELAGKTVIPFCTSMSDGIGSSGESLAALAPGTTWLEGRRFGESLDQSAVAQWADGLSLTAAAASAPAERESRALVAYFSMPETADPNNMTQDEEQSTVIIGGEVLGNTQYVANIIREQTGADIFRIEPATPYPTDHDTLVDQASAEQENAARPAILGRVDNIGQYDTIFLGYPTWWSDLPMILYTFLEEYDLSGKTIIPFNTHGGSGFAGTIFTIEEMEPEAVVLEDGFTVSRNDVQEAEDDIIAWLNGLGYTK